MGGAATTVNKGLGVNISYHHTGNATFNFDNVCNYYLSLVVDLRVACDNFFFIIFYDCVIILNFFNVLLLKLHYICTTNIL